MGQQQILLIVLSVILVGIAIAVGITMFQSQAAQSNIDAMIADLNNLGAQAYQYYIRPVSMGGGGNSYTGFHTYFTNLPTGMKSNSNAVYTCVVGDILGEGAAAGSAVRIKAVSALDAAVIRWVLVNDNGAMSITSGETGPTL